MSLQSFRVLLLCTTVLLTSAPGFAQATATPDNPVTERREGAGGRNTMAPPSEEGQAPRRRRPRNNPPGEAGRTPRAAAPEGTPSTGGTSAAPAEGTTPAPAAPTTPQLAPAPTGQVPSTPGTPPDAPPAAPAPNGEGGALPAPQPEAAPAETAPTITPGAPGTVGIGTAAPPAAPGTAPAENTNPAPAAEEQPAAGLPRTPGAAARPSARTGTASAEPANDATAPSRTPAARKPAAPRPAAPLFPVVDRKLWAPVFQRHPLGFDRNTPARAAQDLSQSLERLTHSPAQAVAFVGLLGWGFLAGLAGLAVLIAALKLVERKRPRSWRRLWGLARVAVRRNRLWQSLVAIAERTATPFLALTLWTFGTLLADEESVPATLVQNLLGLWTSYRLINESSWQFLRRFGQSPAGGLYPVVRRLLLFAACWGGGWLVMDAFTYREDVVALWVAGGHLLLVLGVFALLLRRDRILDLLPSVETGATGAAFTLRRAVTGIYYPLVYASLILSLLWVIGYQELASVFLGRSWAVVGICVVTVLLYRSGVQLLARWIQDDPNTQEIRDEALAAGKGLLSIAAWIVAFALSLRALGLRSAVVYAFSQTWLQLGSIRLTGHAIWASIIVVVGILLLSRWLQAMLAYRLYPALGVGRGEAYALNRLLHYALMVAAALLALNNLGLSPANIALVLGGLSVGIGFGLQDIANNIASGLILLTSRQVRQGDVISVGERMGTVREVNLRSTMVTTFDNVDLLIPNAKLLGDTLINWTHSSTNVRSKIPFGVSYNADPEVVLDIARSIAGAHPDVLPEPAPAVFLTEMGDNALLFELFVWVDMAKTPRPRVTTEIYCQLFAEFKARGIEIPYPQRDLHVRSGVPWQELIQALQGKAEKP